MPENPNMYKKIITGPNEDHHRVISTDNNRLYHDGVLQAEPEMASESPTKSPPAQSTEEAMPGGIKLENVTAHQESSQHILDTAKGPIHAVDVHAMENSRQGLARMNDQSIQAMFNSYSNLPARRDMAQNTSATMTQTFQGRGYTLADGGMTNSGAQR